MGESRICVRVLLACRGSFPLLSPHPLHRPVLPPFSPLLPPSSKLPTDLLATLQGRDERG